MKLHTYLTFKGQCKEAFQFYEKCLGGKIEMMMTHAESPMAEQAPPEMQNQIMHASMTVAGTVLMGSDAPPQYAQTPAGFCVSIGVEQPAEAERIFTALSDGGTVNMPLQKTFWAERFGMLVDRFGTPWMINCEPAR